MKHVVRIDPPHDLAVSLGEALVQRVGVTFVRFADDRIDRGAVLLDYQAGSIGAGAVGDHILQFWIILGHDRPECIFQIVRTVEVRCDDADRERFAVGRRHGRVLRRPRVSAQSETVLLTADHGPALRLTSVKTSESRRRDTRPVLVSSPI